MGTMRTMSTTRRASTTSRGRGRIRGGPVDELFERAKSWRPPSDSGLAQASTPDGTVGADRVVVDVSTDDALGTDDLCGLVDRLARGEVSSEELWDAAMGRAEQANRVLNAVCTWVERSSAGRADGPFAGVPSAVKDNEDLAGYPTSWGSRAVPDRPAQVSTAFVEQFLQLGLAPIAKTTLPEFGFTASAESSRFGATVNPWDTGRSAGGSSGGSAALVAAGVVPVAHGNDGGGSLRIPAAACGLVSLKASRGRIVDRPEEARMPVSYKVQGVLTRTVRDTARYLAEAERLYANPDLPPVGLVAGPSPRRLRIGLTGISLTGTPVAAVSRQAVADTARVCEDLGHHVEPVEPRIDDRFCPDLGRYFCLLAFMMRHAGARMLGGEFHADRLDPLVTGMSALGARSLWQMPTTLRRLRRLAAEGEAVFDDCDVLLVPSAGHETPPIGHLAPGLDADEHLVRLLRFMAGNPVQNISGAPALALPLARTATGLPVGVQLVAPRGQERRLLELAFELEMAAPWPHRPSTAPSAAER